MKLMDNIYYYQVDNKLYFLDHEIYFDKRRLKSENYRKNLKKELKKEAFQIEIVKKSKVSHKEIKKGFYASFFIAFLMIYTIKANKLLENKFYPNIIESSLDKLDVENGELPNLLTKLERALNCSLNESVYDEIVNNVLFAEFDSKKDGFLYYALKCIEINPSFTDQEKGVLKKEVTKKINTFGDYYSGKRILVSLIEYANVDVKREYGLSTSIFEQGKGHYGLITYDPSWENSAETLHHELCHAELKGEDRLPIYSEARAAFLSKSGYSKSRALFTLLGILGDEEKVLKGLLNNNPEEIYGSINEDITSEFKVDYIREILESIENPLDLENYSLSLYETLQELYLEKYNYPSTQSPGPYILSYILLNGTGKYTTNDNLVLNGSLPVVINKLEILREVNVPLGSDFTMVDLKNEELSILIQYLKDELENYSEKSFEDTANFYVISIIGTDNYSEFVESSQPYNFLYWLNRERAAKGFKEITVENIERIIKKKHNGTLETLAEENWYLDLIEEKLRLKLLVLENNEM